MDGSGKGEIKMKLLKVVVLVALMSLGGHAHARYLSPIAHSPTIKRLIPRYRITTIVPSGI